MTRRMRSMLFIGIAFVSLSAGECEFDGLLNQSGSIIVTNTGTEEAVVAIIAPDVKSYPTLAGGASATVSTTTGGRYEVRVVMTPENALNYRAELAALRGRVEQLIDGSLSTEEKTRLFVQLAGIKAAISALEMANAAGCGGSIELNQESAASVNATVQWVSQSGAGFWDVTCGST